MKTRHERYVEAAKRYAAADRSDPFAFSRAMTHINNGVASALGDGRDAAYDATETTETRRLPDGLKFMDGSNEWNVPAYRNMVRP
jgi:hypothetical protein